MDKFELISEGLLSLIKEWQPKLSALGNDVISERRNSQNRTIKQITGHMVDSATNNTQNSSPALPGKSPDISLLCK